MDKSKLLAVLYSGIFSLILLLSTSVNASSFPFRSVNPGDSLPGITLADSASGKPFALDSNSGKSSILVFWNGDVESKKSRAIKTLKVFAELQDFMKAKKMSVLVVNIGNDTPGTLAEVMSGSGLSTTVYMDSNQSAYGGLGIFVMPSIMLVDGQGKISSGLGYSNDLKKRLHGEIEIMLGEKDREQLDKELHPETIEKSAEEKNSKRHFHLGETMIQRGQPEVAVKEFNKALEFEPTMSEAHIKLGCLYLELNQGELAREHLTKGMEENPDSVEGQICQAEMRANAGEVAEAADDLQFLLLRNGRNHHLHYVFATLLEKQGKLENAIREYRMAYELVVKKEMHK
ncbi:MAG: tetratricopeptide repeat protein [Proteobacteria bacterium]|nr:tetratricopeptide repeat protein [Pseudomonadota bacterium]MBU1737955.1 tetratricopeptide repeat protein [Pseudomonadota bacterium]